MQAKHAEYVVVRADPGGIYQIPPWSVPFAATDFETYYDSSTVIVVEPIQWGQWRTAIMAIPRESANSFMVPSPVFLFTTLEEKEVTK